MTISGPLWIVCAYLWGAAPSSYVVARWLKGVDLRESGSGNVGASNLGEHTSRVVGILVGIFDAFGKAAASIILARFLDQSLAMQAAVALAVVVGHNWSPYIRMTGGRGISTAIGAAFAFGMWWEILAGIVIIGIVGRWWLKDTGFWAFVMIVALPPLTIVLGRATEVTILFACMAVVLLLKRLTSNWDWPRGPHRRRRVLINRLLWDRDVRRQEEWTRRGIECEAT